MSENNDKWLNLAERHKLSPAMVECLQFMEQLPKDGRICEFRIGGSSFWTMPLICHDMLPPAFYGQTIQALRRRGLIEYEAGRNDSCVLASKQKRFKVITGGKS